MVLLALDTAANLCAACVHDTDADRVLARRAADIGTGHAELLMDQIGDCLSEAGKAYRDLSRIAVSMGPGSFTGVRIGVAAARGLALALAIPALGVSTLEGLAAEARAAHPGRAALAVIDAGRGQVWAALYGPDGAAVAAPSLAGVEAVRALALEADAVLAGSAAALVGEGTALPVASQARTAAIETYARLGASRTPPFDRPKPLYLRAADARPQQGFALPRREESA